MLSRLPVNPLGLQFGGTIPGGVNTTIWCKAEVSHRFFSKDGALWSAMFDNGAHRISFRLECWALLGCRRWGFCSRSVALHFALGCFIAASLLGPGGCAGFRRLVRPRAVSPERLRALCPFPWCRPEPNTCRSPPPRVVSPVWFVGAALLAASSAAVVNSMFH